MTQLLDCLVWRGSEFGEDRCMEDMNKKTVTYYTNIQQFKGGQS